MEPRKERVVVSSRTFVDPNKVGKRSTSSIQTQVDAGSSSRIEETPYTRSYVKVYYDPSKDFRPRMPSAPPAEPLSSCPPHPPSSESSLPPAAPFLSPSTPPSLLPINPAVVPKLSQQFPPVTSRELTSSRSPTASPVPPSIPPSILPSIPSPIPLPTPPASYTPSSPSSSPKVKRKSAPPSVSSYPSPSFNLHDSPVFAVIKLFILFSLLFGGIYYFVFHLSFTEQTHSVTKATWKFHGKVSEWKAVKEEGWEMPVNAKLLHSETRVHRYREVVARIDLVCKDVLEEYEELDKFETECYERFQGYEETYSHTNEVCYSDGECEQEDVYVKGSAIYSEECSTTPVYVTKTRQVTKCENVEIKKLEPVEKEYFTYEVMKWIHLKEVNFDSEKHTKDDPGKLQEGHKYTSEEWEYLLHLDDSLFYKVKREDFEKFEKTGTGTVVVRKFLFGLWELVQVKL